MTGKLRAHTLLRRRRRVYSISSRSALNYRAPLAVKPTISNTTLNSKMNPIKAPIIIKAPSVFDKNCPINTRAREELKAVKQPDGAFTFQGTGNFYCAPLMQIK
jgi:hypothetical protein